MSRCTLCGTWARMDAERERSDMFQCLKKKKNRLRRVVLLFSTGDSQHKIKGINKILKVPCQVHQLSGTTHCSKCEERLT